ncbi:hypothetical protein IMZ48_37085, partial [Candidatus Bathyarchaeota archaeon]|nr:hypothetical protein [Candidatus Bathyarchaeota archaeon]
MSSRTCKCYNTVGSEATLPDEKCDNWCDGNSDLGRCGSCSNAAYSNLYSCEPPAAQNPAPAPSPRTTIVIPPYSAPAPPAPVPTPEAQPQPEPETSVSCVTVVTTPVVEPQTVTVVTTPVVEPQTSTSCVTIVSTPFVPPPPATSPAAPVTYGPKTGTVVVQETKTTWSSKTSTWTSSWESKSTSTSTSTWTSYSSYSAPQIPAQPSYSAPQVPGGYGDGVNPPAPAPTVQGTSVVTPPVYGSGVVPATASGYTSTQSGEHPHSTAGGTPGETGQAAGAGGVSGSLFAV